LKVAILLDELAPGSAPVILGHTIRGLRSLGYDAEALVIVNKPYSLIYPEVYNHYLRGDIAIHYIMQRLPRFFTRYNFKFPGFSFFSLHHITSGLFAPFIFKEKEYDLIIAYCQYSSFIARALSTLKKIPYLLLMWDPAPYTFKKIYLKRNLKFFTPLIYPLTLLLDKFAYAGCRALITSGRLHHKYLKRVTKKNLEILYPGCNPIDKLPDFSRRENFILTYDRWDIGNDPKLFLKILERLNNPKIKLVIGGFWHPAGLKDSFLKELKKKNLSGQVELLGPLTESAIRDLCSRAMVHLHYNEEAFGMQSLEAASCGCPIIIPRGSGVTDLFQHGVHGYFPQKNDLESFVTYLELILRNPQMAQAMGRNAWEVAKSNTWDNYAQNLDKIIKKYAN
jgi:glycosyltransferase involved in cell wall biosynthesis